MVIKGKVLISSNFFQSKPKPISDLHYSTNIVKKASEHKDRLQGNIFFLSLIENRNKVAELVGVHALNYATMLRKLIDGISNE